MSLLRRVKFLLIVACALTMAAPANAATPFGLQRNFNDTIVIQFDYKQSALYQSYTFDVMDSVANILKRDTAIRLSIDGYAYKDEGNDTVIKYLSLNRALFVRDYILGRGTDPSRILSVSGKGTAKSLYKNTNAEGKTIHCRAELLLIYPPPPPVVVIADRDEDGIADADDKCPDTYGYKELNGCPKDVIIVPFEYRQSSLHMQTYQVLDSVVLLLKQNPAYTVSLEGHAYKEEGSKELCDQLAKERAVISKDYLLSRYIAASRIDGLQGVGNTRPLNAAKNPKQLAANCRVEITLNRHQP